MWTHRKFAAEAGFATQYARPISQPAQTTNATISSKTCRDPQPPYQTLTGKLAALLASTADTELDEDSPAVNSGLPSPTTM